MKRKSNGPFTTSATASTIGSIMAVVAVLEIHMERNIVVNMKPNIKRACKQGKLSCLDKDPGFNQTNSNYRGCCLNSCRT